MVLALLALLAAGPGPHYRVYVFTAPPAGGQAEQANAREEAVRDLRDALARKKQFQIVDDRREADIIVEVLDREVQEAGEGGFGGAKLTKLANTIIRLRVSHATGGEGSELKGMGPGGRAVKDAADRVEKWADRDQPTPHKRGKFSPPSTVMTLPVE
jgi:hypothetical protein